MSDTIKETLCGQLNEVIYDVVDKLCANNEDLVFHENAMLSDRFLKDFENSMEHSGVICKSMSHPEAYLPYQEYIPDEIKHGIDSGALNLLSLFKHPTFGCKYVTSDVKEANGPLAQCYMGSNMFYRFSIRDFYAIVHDLDKSIIRGDRANKLSMVDLWNATSPELDPPVHPNKARFSLLSSIMTFRTSACQKRLRGLQSFTQYEHPENYIYDNNHERLSRCGLLYCGTMQIARAYNASMFRCFGCPTQQSSTYSMYKDAVFSEQEAKAVAGAIARLYNRFPEQTEQMADLCYTNVAAYTLEGKHPNTLLLHRHLSKLNSMDDVQQSLLLLQQKRNAEWSDLQVIDQDAHYRYKVQPQDEDSSVRDKFMLGNPENYAWVSPKDAVITRIQQDSHHGGNEIVKEGSHKIEERPINPYVQRKNYRRNYSGSSARNHTEDYRPRVQNHKHYSKAEPKYTQDYRQDRSTHRDWQTVTHHKYTSNKYRRDNRW